MRWAALSAAIGILLVADVVVLLGVQSRRAEGRLEISERELALDAGRDDNSAITLRLRWRGAEFNLPRLARTSLEAAKIRELGLEAPGHRPASKAVFAVLALEEDAPAGETRLRAVDVGLDPARLRARYPDRSRYAVAQAVAAVNWGYHESPPQPHSLLRVVPPMVYVPPAYVHVFEGLARSQFEVPVPRYSVALCYSAAGQPWICGARRTP